MYATPSVYGDLFETLFSNAVLYNYLIILKYTINTIVQNKTYLNFQPDLRYFNTAMLVTIQAYPNVFIRYFYAAMLVTPLYMRGDFKLVLLIQTGWRPRVALSCARDWIYVAPLRNCPLSFAQNIHDRWVDTENISILCRLFWQIDCKGSNQCI